MYPIPKNYKIHYQPNLENKTFIASEIITFNVDKNTKTLSLDCKDINIDSIKLLDENVSFNQEKDTLILNFINELEIGKDYQIEITFNAELKEGLAGWYLSKYEYEDDNSKKTSKYIATSHFEAADARRAFPGVDHPNYKATFDISFTIDKNLTAISNTLPIKEDEKDGKKYIEFATTPLMSTYLLYLGVGEFEFFEDRYNKVIIRGITTPGKKQYTEFAVETAKKVLQFFEEYFDFAYPLQKVDLIAVPDFAAGAMENWGAITFRETALLYYPNRTAISKKNYIAEVVAHELAHQWFGNLVTMKWWNDLWLNESFATFMAYKALDQYWKEWDVWTQYLGDTVFRGMHLDSLKSSHPIQVEVNNVEEIDELFDEIAYDKGGSILRMLENYLSADLFRDGLRQYIKTFQYKNAEGKNLWETLESSSKKPVTSLMESYIEQTGFPIIEAELNNNNLKLSQKRFSLLPLENNNQKWVVPVVISDGKNTQREIIENNLNEIKLSNNPEYLDINEDYSGFYISKYSEDLLEKLGINYSKLSNKDRLGILNDLSYLTFSTEIKLEVFTNFIEKYLLEEKDFSVLEFALGKLSKIYNLIEKESIKPTLIKLAKRSLELTGMEPQENEYVQQMLLRNGALLILARFDDEDIKKFILNKFEEYKKDPDSLHANLRGVTFLISVWSNDKNYDYAFENYKKNDIQEEKLKFLSALGFTKNKDLIAKTLDFTLSSDVRFSNIIYIFSSLSSNPNANDLALNWVFNNWNKLLNNGGGMAHNILRSVLKYTIPKFGIGNEDKVNEFVTQNKNENLQKTFEQVCEQLEINSRFVRENK